MPCARIHTGLTGQRAVGLCGPEAARFFYDQDHIARKTAVPGPVLSTLMGHGAVQTLDGAAHRARKAMFMSLMTADSIAALVERTLAAWDAAAVSWSREPSVILFDEVSRVLTRGVCDWAGVPLVDAEVADVAADLTAMVDGFATLGPGHWRARRARRRRGAWLGHLVEDVRRGVTAPAGHAADVVAHHRDADGELLESRIAAVELLNVLRPTGAVTWFVVFAAHALHRWPEHRARLRDSDPAFAEAFAQEVRRFYPFAPFVAGRGQNHDARLWPDPYRFDPDRFHRRPADAFELVPQGTGDPHTGHRCAGDGLTVALLQTLVVRLARLEYDVPDQDLTIPLARIPTRPKTGFVIAAVRATGHGASAATGSRPASDVEPVTADAVENR